VVSIIGIGGAPGIAGGITTRDQTPLSLNSEIIASFFNAKLTVEPVAKKGLIHWHSWSVVIMFAANRWGWAFGRFISL
jgi:hypothetical protein